MVERKRKEVWSGPVSWLLSHRALVVSWMSSFLILWVVFFCLAGVGLLGLFLVRLVLRIFVQEGLVASESGPLRETPFGELPFVKVLRESSVMGLLPDCGDASLASSSSLGLLGLFCFRFLRFRCSLCFCCCSCRCDFRRCSRGCLTGFFPPQ